MLAMVGSDASDHLVEGQTNYKPQKADFHVIKLVI